MNQIANNSPEQALLGDLPVAIDGAVMATSEVHQDLMMQYLGNPKVMAGFQRIVLDMLLAKKAA